MRADSRVAAKAEYYRGVRLAPYDLVKEALVAFGIVLVLVVALAVLFSSPDVPPLTIRQVAQQTPRMFLQVALGDLDGQGEIASYGPPYNHGTEEVQSLGPVSLQELAGVTIPVDPRQDFVLAPLRQMGKSDPHVAALLQTFSTATAQQQQQWEAAYAQALEQAAKTDERAPIAAGAYGPVGGLLGALLQMGQQGALDGYLLTSPNFYQTDYTKPLLFIQGAPLHAKATTLHLLGKEWGMMNEAGSWPGQAWLWLYTFWYQIPAYASSPSGDAYVWLTMAVLTLGFILVPFLPGVNRLPQRLGLYKLIWRDYYREQREVRRAAQRDAATQ